MPPIAWPALSIALLLASAAPGQTTVGRVDLTTADLYAGLEARRVLPAEGGLALDNRNQTSPPTDAQITTDAIDLGGEGLLTGPLDVQSVSAAVLSNAADEDRLVAELRSGTTYFQAPGTWSDWSPGPLAPPRGRYVQLRIRAQSKRPELRIRGARIDFTHSPAPAFAAPLKLADANVPPIVRSTIAFGYQRPDHADLLWLRRTFRLDEVIAPARTELEKVNALCTWVASRTNDRHKGWNTLPYYPWAVRRLLGEADGGTVYGHCASYCAAFIACCNAMGWQGRHFGVEGYKRRSHEVAEVYLSTLGRWVYFDASLATYYVDRKTGRPLDIVQMHQVYLDTHFNQPGDTVPALERDTAELDRRRAKIDWDAFPARPISADWVYGKKQPWGWTWGQGVVTTAWLQMTPRNNFLDQPEPIFRNFSDYPTGVNGFPVWTDERTPPRTSRTRNFFTRRRDFYWTLDQAALRLVRTAENTLAVELGNSQPFFKEYRLTLDGRTRTQTAAALQWKLHPGQNALVVHPVDEFGHTGAGSAVTIELGPAGVGARN